MRSFVKTCLFLLMGLATSKVANACCFESDVIEFFSCTNVKAHCFADTAKRGCNTAFRSDYQCHNIIVYCCKGGGQQYQTTDTSKPCGPHCGPNPCLATRAANRPKRDSGQAFLLLSEDIGFERGCR